MFRLCRGLIVTSVLFFFVSLLVSAAALAEEGEESETKDDGRNRMVNSLGVKDVKDDDSPLYIKANSLLVNSKKRMFIYKDQVEAIRGDMVINAELLNGYYDENDELEKVVCTGNVRITKGEALNASSNRAEYKVKEGILEMTEGPQLFQRGNLLLADKVLIFVEEDRSEAVGNVRVKVVDTKNVSSQSGTLSDSQTSSAPPANWPWPAPPSPEDVVSEAVSSTP